MTRRLLLVLAVFLCYIIVVFAQRAKSSAENDDDPFALLEDMEGAIVPPEHHESNLHHILAAISHAFAILIRFSGYLAKPLTFAGGYLYSFAVWFGGILAYVAAPVLVLLQVAWMICIEWPMALIHYLAETLFPLYVFCGIAAVFGAFWGGVGGVISQFVISLLVGTDDDRYPTDQAVVLSKGKAPLRNRKSSQGIQYVEKEKSTLVEGYSSSDSDLEHADDWNWQEKEENNRL